MWLIITLIIVGILLLVAELVLLPGISVAGIGAFLSLAVAAVYGFFLYGILGGSVVLAAIIIVAVAAVVVSLRANTWQRLSLKSTIDATSTPTPEQNDIRIGQRGETLTRLAPMGKVQVGDVTVEAKSVDAYIDPRQVVEVIGYDNTAVVVRRIAAQERAEERGARVAMVHSLLYPDRPVVFRVGVGRADQPDSIGADAFP